MDNGDLMSASLVDASLELDVNATELTYDGELSIDTLLSEALHTIRKHMGMDAAFISEFSDGMRIFRHLDCNENAPPLEVGDSDPLDQSYCQRVVDGRLPEVIHDASVLPEALDLTATKELPVRAHISVPIYLSDGRIYGTFCCFSTRHHRNLNKRDLNVMKMFADFSGKQIERYLTYRYQDRIFRKRIQSVITEKRFASFFQPIFRISDQRILGYEALTRFSAEPIRPPNVWFSEAEEVGLQEELELAAIESALDHFHQLPVDAYLALNVSPATIKKQKLHGILRRFPLNRLVLEITEHASIDDYGQLLESLAPLRDKGLALAVDDAGAGYSTFTHILELNPDIIKLDRSLILNIHENQKSRALAAALVKFADETGSKIIAEGIENKEELETLAEINVRKAQGFYLGRPMPIDRLFRH
jgi:EAL domain-containing protein (putative c-di-GMP-specific phosphodiesterase class I)